MEEETGGDSRPFTGRCSERRGCNEKRCEKEGSHGSTESREDGEGIVVLATTTKS